MNNSTIQTNGVTSVQDNDIDKLNHSAESLITTAQHYVSNPERLRADLSKLKKEETIESGCLPEPAPDQFPYKMTLYNGFINYRERVINYVLNHQQPRSSTVRSFPTILDLEPNSICNFRCVMCQVSQWPNGQRANNMSFDDLKSFVGERPLYTEIKLHGMGEPLMHRKYCEMVSWLTGKDIWVRTSINGSLLHKRNNFIELIDSGIGEIQGSFDGASKEVFETIRVRSDFEQVVKNFKMLNQYANKKNRLYTRMWVLLQKSNRHQLYQFIELAKQMEFRRLTFSLSLNGWGQEPWEESNSELKLGSNLTVEEEEKICRLGEDCGIEITKWYQSERFSTRSKETMCPWVFHRPYITSDLRVVPCAIIANPDVLDFGDAKELENVWFGEGYRSFREQHLSGKIPTACKACYTDAPIDTSRKAQSKIT